MAKSSHYTPTVQLKMILHLALCWGTFTPMMTITITKVWCDEKRMLRTNKNGEIKQTKKCAIKSNRQSSQVTHARLTFSRSLDFTEQKITQSRVDQQVWATRNWLLLHSLWIMTIQLTNIKNQCVREHSRQRVSMLLLMLCISWKNSLMVLMVVRKSNRVRWKPQTSDALCWVRWLTNHLKESRSKTELSWKERVRLLLTMKCITLT